MSVSSDQKKPEPLPAAAQVRAEAPTADVSPPPAGTAPDVPPVGPAAHDDCEGAGGTGPRATPRASGTTTSERYLTTLCDRSFLSLWSYPGVYKDQGNARGGDGKEVCDLLVVFGNHVLVFSDKDCAFGDSGRFEVDWSRWYKKAVHKSADQVYGAERWIRAHPDRLFLDRACTIPFPVPLPAPELMIVHRIVVAHGVSARCRAHFGGTGSLLIVPRLRGKDHYAPDAGRVLPFAVGDVDPTRGFVHVLDDQSLRVLLRTLDTVSDFVAYLSRKERFVRSGRLISAAGEDDLLAFYLKHLDAEGAHDFVLPAPKRLGRRSRRREAAPNAIVIDEGFWDGFVDSPQRQAQLAADRVSYVWDALIEEFNGNALAGTLATVGETEIARVERILRYMARESRTRRRMLAGALVEHMARAPTDRYTPSVRLVAPSRPGDPYYLFMTLAHKPGMSDEDYRRLRGLALERYAPTVRLRYPDATAVVGIATEPGRATGPRSEDAILFDCADWNADVEQEAREWMEAGGLKSMVETRAVVSEFPSPARGRGPATAPAPVPRRQGPCPCGSGRKFKRCCGA